MSVRSGAKTGRSPGDKRIVKEPSSDANIWWGDVNMPISEHTFAINRERAIDYLNVCPVIYVVDAFAGWDPELRIKVRIVCTRAYHALFMTNMLIVPSADELATFGEPDVTIYNAGAFPANRFTEGMTSAASVALHFGKLELVILGTEYAGEMKKGVFTVMNYLMPLRGVLSMHSSCNVSKTDPSSVTLFFGLSGTGKTTLSADPHRELIGDDEHLWSDRGISNIEGGCYAKVDNLSATDEPEIHGAIRYGCVVENVVLDPQSREIDFHDLSLTSNTRASYPLGHIPSARIPALSTHPNNVVLLTADAFGVLPPVSKLTPEQVSYLFIVGYTSKIPGTEVGVTEPVATFSPCFGGPFIPLAPAKYAEMLAERLKAHSADAWLLNTGWTGGRFGTGKRTSIKFTRAILDAIHDGTLAKSETTEMDIFGLRVPTKCPGVPDDVLQPRKTWADKDEYDKTLRKLAEKFNKAFAPYADKASDGVRAAGPKI
jgi:phosphoenolpyruvate carboxykinase (ATP)